jgi:aspartyl-tRNA(Asn)/glutamyl-tRNA(Gln) amidotransferase subunit A
MNPGASLPVCETLDPGTLPDPASADRSFRKRCRSGSLPAQAQVESRPLEIGIAEAGVSDLLSAFADRTLTPAMVVDHLVTRIAGCRAGSEAVLRLADGIEAAVFESTARWANGTARPLEGVPFGIKDIIDVEATKTTSGSWFTGDRIAPADADVVARLRANGAIPLAMLATTEFACGSPNNPRFGRVTNPWDRERWTGGSSTGSGAALAARLMPFALGTDTGGSIRVPSCWCGTTGLKPSRELVSRQGVAPLSWTLDHIGPMTRSARDIAVVLPYMAAEADADLLETCRQLLAGASAEGLRIGVPVNWFVEEVDAAVLENWQSALEVFKSFGCSIKPLPALPVEGFHQSGWTVLLSELAAHHAERMPQAEFFDRGLLVRLKQGIEIAASDYGRALMRRPAAQAMFLDAMADVDLIVTPGLGGEAGFIDTLTVDVDGQSFGFQDIISRNTMIFDYTGFPALMLPSGFGRSRMPTGIQVVGRPGDDALCLRLGIAFQAATGHHLARPPETKP